MTAIAFDTHAYVKRLTAVGVPEEQAEVHAQTIASLIEGELATKHDIEVLQQATKRDIEELRRDMKEMELSLRRDIAEIKADLVKWLIGLLFLQAGFIVALIKLL